MSQNLIKSEDHRVDSEHPWPGLTAYSEKDQSFFHGRRKEIDELYRSVMRAPLTIFYGQSGLGKTSLLQAGLFPILRQKDIFPVYIRLDYPHRDFNPSLQVRQFIFSETDRNHVEAPVSLDHETLWEFFHRTNADFWGNNRLLQPLLVFDQFEEIFTLGRSNPDHIQICESFLVELGDLIEGRPPQHLKEYMDKHPEKSGAFDFERHYYKVLLSLREDYIPEIEGLRERIPSVIHHWVRLQSMTGAAAMEVAGHARHLITRDVAEKVVRFVAAPSRKGLSFEKLTVEPALLSVFCRELNNKRLLNNESRISENLLQGSQEEILNAFYERSVSDLDPVVRTFIEEKLITVHGFRDSIAVENAIYSHGISPETIKTLIDRRLVRIEEREGKQRVELTHDLLTKVIAISREHRHQLEKEKRLEEKKQKELKIAKEKAEKERIEREKERKNQQKIVLIVGFAAMISLAFGIYGLLNKNKAEKAAMAVINTDIESLYHDERYSDAIDKLEELRTFTDNLSVQTRMKEYMKMDSLSKIFYKNLNVVDTLISKVDIDHYIEADSVLRILVVFPYKPGMEKLDARISTYQRTKLSIISSETELARRCINAGGQLIPDAIMILNKILKLDPGNREAKELLNSLNRG